MFDITEQLLTHAQHLSPQPKGDSVWIKCPFHADGHERTPSCRVNIVKNKYPAGFFYCYGCGEHGDWNKLAEKIANNLPRLEGETKREQEVESVRKFTETEKNEMFGVKTQIFDFESSVPWHEDRVWRNISGKLLNAVGGRLFYNEKVKDQNLFLPCYQNGELQGGIQALLEKKGNASIYRNTAGAWVKKTWFLYDYQKERIKKKDNIIAVVEGPRDALNFTQYGFPAIAMLGSKNWSSQKATLLQMLNPKLVVLALDPDEAGQQAFETIDCELRKGLNVLKVSFESDEDPGNLPPKKVKALYKKIQAYAKNL